MDSGEVLSESDIEFLDTVIHDAEQAVDRPAPGLAFVLLLCHTSLRNDHRKGIGKRKEFID